MLCLPVLGAREKGCLDPIKLKCVGAVLGVLPACKEVYKKDRTIKLYQ